MSHLNTGQEYRGYLGEIKREKPVNVYELHQLKKKAALYDKLSKLTPTQYRELWERAARTGIDFDVWVGKL